MQTDDTQTDRHTHTQLNITSTANVGGKDHQNSLNITFAVLEHTGVPVTGTPSISFEFYFIINRWTIYPRGDTYIDGDPSINVIK